MAKAVNNVEVKDYDVEKGMTLAQVKEIQRSYTLLLNKNEVKLSAEVVAMNQSDPKPVIDKSTGNEVLDPDTGEVRFYPINYFVKLAFNGGEKEISVPKAWYDDLKMDGSRYLFEGRIGSVRSYGKDIIDVVFSNYELI